LHPACSETGSNNHASRLRLNRQTAENWTWQSRAACRQAIQSHSSLHVLHCKNTTGETLSVFNFAAGIPPKATVEYFFYDSNEFQENGTQDAVRESV
jgi:hypothetical protein